MTSFETIIMSKKRTTKAKATYEATGVITA
jgi:hypothetical protein